MSGTHDTDPFAHLARHHHDEPRPSPVRIGIGGPVGSGKTALVAALCRTLGDELSLAVVTNDIYTTEDADFLRRGAVLPDERIAAVKTGCCPHTAIRDDITANLDAIEDLVARVPGVQLVLVESGGDNLTASFSAGLVDAQVFVVDVAGGDKVPRKGGPGVTMSDLLVVNKTDLAPLVGASLRVMADDAARVREGRPTLLVSLREDPTAAPGRRLGARGRGPGDGRRGGRPLRTTVEVVAESPRVRRRRARRDRGGPSCARCGPTARRWRCAGPGRGGDDGAGPVAGPGAAGARVHLVGTAAGPMGGDVVEVRLVVGPGACLEVAGVAATLVLPARTEPRSRLLLDVEVAAGGRLVCALPPVVVTGRAALEATTRVRLAGDAQVRLVEHVRLGPPRRAGRVVAGAHRRGPRRLRRCCGRRPRWARTRTTVSATCAACWTPAAAAPEGRSRTGRGPSSWTSPRAAP